MSLGVGRGTSFRIGEWIRRGLFDGIAGFTGFWMGKGKIEERSGTMPARSQRYGRKERCRLEASATVGMPGLRCRNIPPWAIWRPPGDAGASSLGRQSGSTGWCFGGRRSRGGRARRRCRTLACRGQRIAPQESPLQRLCVGGRFGVEFRCGGCGT